MKILHSLPERPLQKPTVIALGNFDGVHRGHQVLISRTVQKAKEIGGDSLVFTFDPHPLQLIKPEQSPKLLITQERKQKKIAELGADWLLLLPFTREVAGLSPGDFLDTIYQLLNPVAIVVGFNYTYGRHGLGNADTLYDAGKKLGLAVEILPPQKDGEELISSTRIRQELAEGNVKRVKELLGYWPILEGKVVAGDRRGRKLGFPTANVAVPGEIMLPRLGVYAAKCIINQNIHLAVVNVGFKPTFRDECIPVVEAHLLDFAGDIYGCHLEIHLLQYLRPEKRFSHSTGLLNQIKEDVHLARSAFGHL